MRNEIFRQINQNRNRYYSELKKHQKQKIFCPDSLQKRKATEVSIVEKKWSSILSEISIRSNKRFEKAVLFVRDQIIYLSDKTKQYINSIGNRVLQEANIQTNKLTENLTRLSSQLFEDKYEYQHDNQSYEYRQQKTNETVHAIVLPVHLNDGSLQTQMLYWLNKFYFSLILFLESDDWIEKIDRSQHVSTEKKQHNQFKKRLINSFQKVNNSKLFSKIYNNIEIARKVKVDSSSGIDIEFGILKHKFISFKQMNRLKSFSKAIFPAINRFI